MCGEKEAINVLEKSVFIKLYLIGFDEEIIEILLRIEITD